MSSPPIRSEELFPLSLYENDNEVAALLRQWLAAALDWMSDAGLDQRVDLILRELERLRSLPPDTPGLAGTFSLVYGVMIARSEDKQEWDGVVDPGRKVLAVPGLSLTAAELHSFSLGRALHMLGRTDEAIEVYMAGIRRAHDPGLREGIAWLLLEISNIVSLASQECMSRLSEE